MKCARACRWRAAADDVGWLRARLIFDEVDAPLDDVNIDKFNNIIREFSKDSQFIIVTHNKRTMASTNVMYGVTMENTGISKVLAVDLVALNLTE